MRGNKSLMPTPPVSPKYAPQSVISSSQSLIWRRVKFPHQQKCSLHRTLMAGQSFRWIPIAEKFNDVAKSNEISVKSPDHCEKGDAWISELNGYGVLLRQHAQDWTQLEYSLLSSAPHRDTIRNEDGYFQTSVCEKEIDEKMRDWILDYLHMPAENAKNAHVLIDNKTLFDWGLISSPISEKLNENEKNIQNLTFGTRILKIPADECTLSFILSQNANIPRIRQMMSAVCGKYGHLISEYHHECQDEQGNASVIVYRVYSVPPWSSFIDREMELRGMSIGYRAKYLHGCGIMLGKDQESAQKWRELCDGIKSTFAVDEALESERRAFLISLPGIGPKIADCVLLYAFQQLNVVPIDTHMRTLTIQLFPNMKKKLMATTSLTPQLYSDIQSLWVEKYGSLAGWAHAILFAMDLKWLSPSSPQSPVNKRPKYTD